MLSSHRMATAKADCRAVVNQHKEQIYNKETKVQGIGPNLSLIYPYIRAFMQDNHVRIIYVDSAPEISVKFIR